MPRVSAQSVPSSSRKCHHLDFTEFSLCLDENCRRIQRVSRAEDLAQVCQPARLKSESLGAATKQSEVYEAGPGRLYEWYKSALGRIGISGAAAEGLCEGNQCRLPENYEALLNNEDLIGYARSFHAEVNRELRHRQGVRRSEIRTLTHERPSTK